MTLPRTAADVLARHVLFEIESIDRLYLNLYVPELQRVGQVVGFLTRHLGFEIPSTAVIAPRSKAFGEAIKRFAAEQHLPLVDFAKGQRKDDVLHEYLARSDGAEQVLFIGRAQEKMTIFRTERRRNPTTGTGSTARQAPPGGRSLHRGLSLIVTSWPQRRNRRPGRNESARVADGTGACARQAAQPLLRPAAEGS
jgi:hypothetical protein